MKEKFSLIIPTFNEAQNIEKLCRRLLEVLSECGADSEIIVVDDDSPDGTWQIAQALADREKNIRVIRRINEKCLSTAVIAGWSKAEGDILGVIDGDLQHPPEIIPVMVRKILDDKDVDIVVASRNIHGGGVSRWSLFRRSISWLGQAISYFFLPDILAKIKDPMSGYFILRKTVIQGVPLSPHGYKILLEVLANCNYRRVAEVPYFFRERKRGGSKAGLRQYLISLVYIIQLSLRTGQIYRCIKNVFVGLLYAMAIILIYTLVLRIIKF